MRSLLPLMVTVLALGTEAQLGLSRENFEIVDFSFEQLGVAFQLGAVGSCKQQIKAVNNFQEQVVAGSLYTFDLVLEDDFRNAPGCPYTDQSDNTCRMVVLERVWENFREVQWLDGSTCQQDRRIQNFSPVPDNNQANKPGGITQTDGQLSADQQQIVNFGFTNLLDKTARPGSTTKCSLRRVENFREQVVAGVLYQFDFVLSCGGSPTFSCSMKVLDPPSGRKRVQWGRSDCDEQVLDF